MEEPDFAAVGLAIGHATDGPGGTGCTVVRGMDSPFRAAAFVAGRATGTRELGVVAPEHLVDRVDAILLSGGSAYGLDAAAGVMRWMEERGRGFPVGGGVVPIVPAAVVFDLSPIGRFDARPTADMAYAACDAARQSPVGEGSVGAGTGATVGKARGAEQAMKGGVGAAVERRGRLAVAALAVVNAFGDVRDGAGAIIAGARAPAGEFADSARLAAGSGAGPSFDTAALRSTTLAVVATNAALSRQALAQVAKAASGALYRRITPVGTTFDGDIVFATATIGDVVGASMQVEALAVLALEAAIERGVRLARGRDGIPGLADGMRG